MKYKFTSLVAVFLFWASQLVSAKDEKPAQKPFYIISVFAVKTETEAKEKVQVLLKQGYASSYLWIPDYASLNNAPLYSVYIGPFFTRQECEVATENYRKINPEAYGLLVSQEKKRVQITGIGKVTITSQATQKQPQFLITKLGEDKNGIPKSKIAVIYNGKTTYIATVSGIAALIEKREFIKNSIPRNAVAAVGAWWAGAGDYFYLIATNRGLALYQGWQDEQQEGDGYHWKLSKVIPQ